MLPTLSPTDAYEQAKSGEVLLIDVRRPDEWAATGLPACCHGITMGTQDFIPQLQALGANENTPIALICAGGIRSAKVQQHLSQAGFHTVYNVIEGMSGGQFGSGWLARGLPIK